MTRVAIASDAWGDPRMQFASTHIYATTILEVARAAGVEAYPLGRNDWRDRRLGGWVGPLLQQLVSDYETSDVVQETGLCASKGVGVMTVHDLFLLNAHRPEDLISRGELLLSLRRARRVLVTTEFVGTELARRLPWVRPKLARVAFPFKVEPDAREAGDYDGLWVGRIAPNKDPLLYLQLAKALPEYRFAFRGTSSIVWKAYHDRVRQMVEGTPLSTRVSRLGLLSMEQRNALYRSVPVIVSTSHQEGFHMPMMEGYLRGMKLVLPHVEPYVETYGPTEGRPCDALNVYWYAPGDLASLVRAFREAREAPTFAPDPDIVRRTSYAYVGEQLRTLYEEVARR